MADIGGAQRKRSPVSRCLGPWCLFRPPAGHTGQNMAGGKLKGPGGSSKVGRGPATKLQPHLPPVSPRTRVPLFCRVGGG